MILVGWKRQAVKVAVVMAALAFIAWTGRDGLQWWQALLGGALLSVWGDMRAEDGRREAVSS